MPLHSFIHSFSPCPAQYCRVDDEGSMEEAGQAQRFSV